MDEHKLETLMKEDIESVFNSILIEHNYIFPISAKSRAGAEISNYLEDSFVNYFIAHSHDRIYNALSAPKGKTKNPYDFCFNYKCTEANFDDLIWGDIKALHSSYKDSNPDIGTPEKVIKFIMDGHFYLMYVLFKYEAATDTEIKFLAFEDGKYVHCQFLKDVHHTVHITPKPQFQVNFNQPEEYRTRDEFIDFFYTKYLESINRNIVIQNKKKSELGARFEVMKERLEAYNNKFNKRS